MNCACAIGIQGNCILVLTIYDLEKNMLIVFMEEHVFHYFCLFKLYW